MFTGSFFINDVKWQDTMGHILCGMSRIYIVNIWWNVIIKCINAFNHL